MIKKSQAELQNLASRILEAAGAETGHAEMVAQHLALANLSGVDTHGVWHLSGYVKGLKSGEIHPSAKPSILKETPTSALVTGNWTFGHVAAHVATEVGMDKADSAGISVVGLVQSHHIGRLGHFAEMAARQGLISMIWAGGQGRLKPAAVPYGGSERLLHTNPIALGMPAGNEPPFIADFATTAASGVKIDNAYRRRESLPEGWIVDREGNPTTNPADFFDGGAHLPFGSHKGYSIMLAAEVLGRIFTGADAFSDPNWCSDIMRNQGVSFFFVRTDLFQEPQQYQRLADELGNQIRTNAPAPGFSEVMAPGGPEVRARAERARDGIPVAEDIWKDLVKLSETLNLQI